MLLIESLYSLYWFHGGVVLAKDFHSLSFSFLLVVSVIYCLYMCVVWYCLFGDECFLMRGDLA